MTQPIQPWMQEAAKKWYHGMDPNLGVVRLLAQTIAAYAPADQTQRIAELEGGLTQCADALACCYNVLQSPADGTSIQDAALATARALIHKGEPS